MNRKLLLIVNPRSGRAKMKAQLLPVCEIFSKAGFEVTIHPTKERADATLRASAVKPDEFDRIIVCGGDGTLNEVLTGLQKAKVNCPIGYIPCGTLNEWSTSLQISKDIKTAAKDAVGDNQITLDLGKFGERYFAYTASFGAFTEASYSAPQDIKNVLGQAAYFFEGIRSLTNIKPIHLKFECDDRTIEGDYLFGAVSNSMSVGGIVKFKEAAVELNDGLFEVLLIKNPANISEFQSILEGILRQDLDRKGLEFFRTGRLTVTGSADTAWTLDGEYQQGSDLIEITNIHNGLRLITPDKK